MNNNSLYEQLVQKGRIAFTDIYDNSKKILNTLDILTKYKHLLPEHGEDFAYQPATGVYNTGGSYISYYLPWDKILVDKILNAYIYLGWKITGENDYVKTSQCYTFDLRHPDIPDDIDSKIYVQINMIASNPNSKCELVVDHVEMVEKKVWKVVCTDPLGI